MSNTLPLFETGKQYTIWMTPQDISASTGAMTDNAVGAIVFNGLVDEHSEETTFVDDNISPTDCPNSNPVTYEQGSVLEITEISTGYTLGSASGNKLRKALLISLYHKVQIVDYNPANIARTGATGLLTRAVYYVKVSNTGRQVPKQRVPAKASFNTIAVSDGSGGWVTNPSYDTTTPA